MNMNMNEYNIKEIRKTNSEINNTISATRRRIRNATKKPKIILRISPCCCVRPRAWSHFIIPII